MPPAGEIALEWTVAAYDDRWQGPGDANGPAPTPPAGTGTRCLDRATVSGFNVGNGVVLR